MALPQDTAFYAPQFNIITGEDGVKKARLTPLDIQSLKDLGIEPDEYVFDAQDLGREISSTLNELSNELPASKDAAEHPDVQVLQNALQTLEAA